MARHSRRHKPPGTSPGSPILTGEAQSPRIRAIRYTASEIAESEPSSAAECSALAGDGAVLWIDVQGLADVELVRSLGERFGFHPLALEDVVSLGQRPKVDDYDSHLFIIARMPERGQRAMTDQTSIFLGQNFVITFQERYGDCLDPVRDRLRRGRGQIRRSGADYLAYAILDAIVDGYFPMLEALGEAIDDLEDEVAGNPTRASLSRIHHTRRDLLSLRRSVWPLRDALNSLLRGESSLIQESTRVYLRDCHDHSFQIMDLIETYRELAAGLMDIYISSLSQKLNEVMKVLTIIATIFIPLTFLTGIYGMNVIIPGAGATAAFGIIVGAMVTLGLGMLFLFRRMGWMGPVGSTLSRKKRRQRGEAVSRESDHAR